MKKAAVLISSLFLSVAPFTVSAMDPCSSSPTDNEKMICMLQFQISKLQTQLTQLIAQRKDPTDYPGHEVSVCLTLKNNLVVGSTDGLNNGEVSKLQKFLLENNYGDPDGDSGYLLQHVTGYYGVKTAASVVNWQKAHGMDFVTAKSGVGPMTRAKMSCVQPAALCPAYDNKPVVSSINPTSGPVGTTIELQGCNFLGFESDKTVVFTNSSGVKGIFNARADAATRESNTVLRMTIPENICTQQNWYSGLPCTSYLKMEPGPYTIFTNSYGGNSNNVYFTVTQ